MREDRIAALTLLLSICALVVFWYLTPTYPIPTRLAASGGAIALAGTLLTARPVLRVGLFQTISNIIFRKFISELSEKPALTDEQRGKQEDQTTSDLVFQQVFGPMLIGLGTILNGFSGLFA